MLVAWLGSLLIHIRHLERENARLRGIIAESTPYTHLLRAVFKSLADGTSCAVGKIIRVSKIEGLLNDEMRSTRADENSPGC